MEEDSGPGTKLLGVLDWFDKYVGTWEPQENRKKRLKLGSSSEGMRYVVLTP